MTNISVGTPDPRSPAFVDEPMSEKEIEALAAKGYLPAVPPRDYGGSIADWIIRMGEHGGPEEYDELCMTMVRVDVWEKVLDECEGKP